MEVIDCVCWNEKRGECNTITRYEFRNGYNCKVCAFRKTHEEYLKQMGHTYEDEMRKVEEYGRNY